MSKHKYREDVGERLAEEAAGVREPIPRNSLSKLNDEQLWTIYMALRYHKDLVEPLKSATAKLALRVYGIGERKHGWI